MNASANPYAAQTIDQPYAAQLASAQTYDGIGRLTYFGMSFMVNIAFFTMVMIITKKAEQSAGRDPSIAGMLLMSSVLYLGTTFYLAAQRLINIGSSGWWAACLLLPVFSLYISARCLCCPPGYDKHGKLDTAGIVMITLFALFVLLPLLFVVGIAGIGAIA